MACTSYLRFWGKITMAAAILVPFPEAVVPVRPTMTPMSANIKNLIGQFVGTRLPTPEPAENRVAGPHTVHAIASLSGGFYTSFQF